MLVLFRDVSNRGVLLMVSYEDLVYQFTDIYLGTAMECSICRENYTMTDDVEFLDNYMKFFLSLLAAVENDTAYDIKTMKATLQERKKSEIIKFQSFLKHKIVEQSLEKVEKYQQLHETAAVDATMYTEKIHSSFQRIFDEGSRSVEEKPLELLRYVRTNEEKVKEEGDWL